MQARVEALLEIEPQHDVAPVEFSQSDWDRRPFTLRRFVADKRGAVALVFVLVVVETFLVTIGPFLTGEAIDRGIVPGDRDALLAIGGLYVGSVLLGTVVSAARVSWSGRVGEALMESLRVRIFSHFQRLSLGFFTREKGGVLMTRMTSDIDSLTALIEQQRAAAVAEAVKVLREVEWEGRRISVHGVKDDVIVTHACCPRCDGLADCGESQDCLDGSWQDHRHKADCRIAAAIKEQA